MDDADWSALWERMTTLWPKIDDAGPERELTFRRVCGDATRHQLDRAIRKLDEESRYTPKPVDLRSALRGMRGANPVEKAAPSWPDLIRQQMSGCTGHIRQEHADMSDAAVQHWYHQAMAVRAHNHYCPNARKTNEDHCEWCECHNEIKRHVALREKFGAEMAEEQEQWP